MTTKVNCPDAFTEDEPDDATFCDGYADEGCSYTSSPDEFTHVGDKDYCVECWNRQFGGRGRLSLVRNAERAERDELDRLAARKLSIDTGYAEWAAYMESRPY